MTQVFIVHGYTAAPDHHWFPWLTRELGRINVKVTALPMPNSEDPDPELWNNLLINQVGVPANQTILIGHSLGCITLLNFLSGLPAATRIGGLVLAAGFSEGLENIPLLDKFIKDNYDPERVKMISPKRVVFVSENDVIVAPELTRKLARELDAKLVSLPEGGHFMGSDGFTTFPEVLAEIQKML